MKIYIASPYSIGEKHSNVLNQIYAADVLMNLGYNPFLPLLSHYQDFHCHRPEEDWIKNDLIWLASCDAVLRLPGLSKGADAEVKEAIRLNIPVYYSVEDLIENSL